MARARTLLGLAFLGSILFFPTSALSETCTLRAVGRPEDAKHTVYFTKFLKEDNTNGRYKGCKIVRKPEKGTETFIVTPFRHDATIIVHQDNWPG